MIGGKQREQQNFEAEELQVGLGVFNVIAVNPDKEAYEELTGKELKEDSKAVEYLGESKDNNITLRIDFWGEEVKTKKKRKVTFFLENKEKTNKDETKKQYINNTGSCSWSDDPNNLPDWFTKRGPDSYRVAYVGEEDLYNFMRTWLGKLDYKDAETVLSLEWKQLMKGNVKDIRAQIGGEFSVPFVWLNEVKTVDKDGETKEYQSVYNRAFLPEYTLKQFRLVDYSKQEVQEALKKKKSSDLKPHERFVLQVAGEYGSKNFFILKDLQTYNPSMNLVSTNKPILTEDGADY